MNISKEDFAEAARTVALDPTHAESLWQELQCRATANPAPATGGSRFDLAHVAYYFGAMIVLGAMGWFMSSAWEAFGGQGIFFIAAVYATIFATAGWRLWNGPQTYLRTPGGLLVTLAVGMMPLMIYGLERWMGWWPQDDPGSYENFHPGGGRGAALRALSFPNCAGSFCALVPVDGPDADNLRPRGVHLG